MSQSSPSSTVGNRLLDHPLKNLSDSEAILKISIASIVITTVTTAIRFVSRLVLPNTHLWWDDWAALASWACAIGICASNIYAVELGFGSCNEWTSPEQEVPLLKISYSTFLIYLWAISLAKVSVLFFYSRFFARFTWFRRTLWITGGLLGGWLISFFFVGVFYCTPIEKYWDPVNGRHHCLPEKETHLLNAVLDAITDIIILVIPIPVLWKLQTSMKKKIGVIITFLLGYCVVAVSVLRVFPAAALQNNLFQVPSNAFFQYELLLILETPVALLSINLPAIIVLGKHLLKRFKRRSSESDTFDDRGPLPHEKLYPSPEATHARPSQYGLIDQAADFGIGLPELRDIGQLTTDTTATATTVTEPLDGSAVRPSIDFTPTSPSSSNNTDRSGHRQWPPHRFGHEIAQQFSNITQTLSKTPLPLQGVFSTIESRSSPRSTWSQPVLPSSYMFRPGGCEDMYEARITHAPSRHSFSVPKELRQAQSKRSRRKTFSFGFSFYHSGRPARDELKQVDPQTGFRWSEEIKVSRSVDIAVEPRKACEQMSSPTFKANPLFSNPPISSPLPPI